MSDAQQWPTDWEIEICDVCGGQIAATYEHYHLHGQDRVRYHTLDAAQLFRQFREALLSKEMIERVIEAEERIFEQEGGSVSHRWMARGILQSIADAIDPEKT